jgi:7-cyano-7-deazaguanine synthase in queuosine biosynthesis
MCSYVGFTVSNTTLKSNNISLFELLNKIKKLLLVKGGDEFKTLIKVGDFIRVKKECEFTTQESTELLNFLNLSNTQKITFAFFSRLTPEMEIDNKNRMNDNIQPYINKVNESIIMVHGTIPKAEEFQSGIEVDTDLFLYNVPEKVIDYVTKVDGKISMLEITKDGRFKWFDNGLGCYKIDYHNIDIYTNINIEFNYIEPIKLDSIKYYNPYRFNKIKAVALFSGGLDITCSIQKHLQKFYMVDLNEIELLYFDWGTRASKQEIEAGKKFLKLYEEKIINMGYNSKIFKHTIIDVKNMFKNILSGCGLTTTRLIDKNATGAGTHEAEAAISYVPFRNQFLITMAAAYLEQHNPNDFVDIIIGGNLSEGMIYLDNSETFINNMDKTIKVGGQKSINFKVVAPYVNRTKTSIVEDAIQNNFILDTVYSCYFPKEDGSECKECGSCLLKYKALERGKNGSKS